MARGLAKGVDRPNNNDGDANNQKRVFGCVLTSFLAPESFEEREHVYVPDVDRKGLIRNWVEFSALFGAAQDVVVPGHGERTTVTRGGFTIRNQIPHFVRMTGLVGSGGLAGQKVIRGGGRCWGRRALRDGRGCSWRPAPRRRV